MVLPNLNKVTLPMIAILVAIIVFQRYCTPSCTGQQVIVKHDTVRDTHIDTVYKSGEVISKKKDIPHTLIKHDTTYSVAHETDTIYKDLYDKYYARWIYTDTETCKYGKFYIIDTVSQNSIIGRRILANWNVPTAVTTIQTTPATTQVYIGGSIGSTGTSIGVGPDLLLRTKKDAIYGLGAEYIINTGMYYRVSMYYKLQFNKR